MQSWKACAAAALIAFTLTACQSTARKPLTFIDSQGLVNGDADPNSEQSFGAIASVNVGAVVQGGIMSSDIGRSLNEIVLQRAAQVEHFALETGQAGQSQSWSNPATTTGGTIVVGETYNINQSQCRDYTHTLTTIGGERTLRATACRQPNGTWRSVSN